LHQIKASKSRWISISRYSFITGLVLLSAQFILGIEANIYATPPYGPGNIGVHYAMGYVLAAVGLIVIIMAGLSRRIGPIAYAIVGFVSIVIAGETGREFAFISQQSGIYSLSMALFWLVAFIMYFLGQQFSSSRGEIQSPSPATPQD
jgi:hypothetical protein